MKYLVNYLDGKVLKEQVVELDSLFEFPGVFLNDHVLSTVISIELLPERGG